MPIDELKVIAAIGEAIKGVVPDVYAPDSNNKYFSEDLKGNPEATVQLADNAGRVIVVGQLAPVQFGESRGADAVRKFVKNLITYEDALRLNDGNKKQVDLYVKLVELIRLAEPGAEAAAGPNAQVSQDIKAIGELNQAIINEQASAQQPGATSPADDYAAKVAKYVETAIGNIKDPTERDGVSKDILKIFRGRELARQNVQQSAPQAATGEATVTAQPKPGLVLQRFKPTGIGASDAKTEQQEQQQVEEQAEKQDKPGDDNSGPTKFNPS